MPRARTASPMAAAAAAKAHSASLRSTVGPTTRASTRRAGCSGRSSRSTARRSRGPTCSSSPATAPIESMGLKTFGFGFGREDIWEPEEVFWGPEDTWLGDERYSGDRELADPFGAVQMGLIYVNPEGPNGNPDPLAAGHGHSRDVRPDGDERRGDGRADRRRPHGRQDPRRGRCRARRARTRGLPPRAAGPRLEELASAPAWARTRSPAASRCVWTPTPTKWDNSFLEILYGYEWELTKSPAGAWQWIAKDRRRRGHHPRPVRSVGGAPRPC